VIAYQTNCLARVHLLNFKSQVRTLHDPAPRSTSSAATGGQVESAKWFRGDAVLFGGLAFQATDKLTLRAGYPSDADLRETSPGLFENKSPFNFGPNYQLRENIHMQAHYLYGSDLGIST
jgi:hypothetical protein